MFLSKLFLGINGQPSSARVLNYMVFCVATYCVVKAFNAIPPGDAMGLATLLSGYIGAFTIPAAAGKFAERETNATTTNQSD